MTSSWADSWDREDLRFGFLRFSTIKKCPHLLISDHRELRNSSVKLMWWVVGGGGCTWQRPSLALLRSLIQTWLLSTSPLFSVSVVIDGAMRARTPRRKTNLILSAWGWELKVERPDVQHLNICTGFIMPSQVHYRQFTDVNWRW